MTRTIKKPAATPGAPTPAQQRKADYTAMVKTMKQAKPCITPPITFCNSNTARDYSGHDLLEPLVRVNAAQAFALPSRVGGRLNYPSGRITDLADRPLPKGTVI